MTAQLSSRIQSPGREAATTGETTQDSEGEGEKQGFSLPFSLPSPSTASQEMSPARSQLIRESGKYNLNIIRPLRHPAEQRNRRDVAEDKQAQDPLLPLTCVPNICTKRLNEQDVNSREVSDQDNKERCHENKDQFTPKFSSTNLESWVLSP